MEAKNEKKENVVKVEKKQQKKTNKVLDGKTKTKKAKIAVRGKLYVKSTISNFSNQVIFDFAIFFVYFFTNSKLPCVHFEWRFLNAT